MSNIKTPSLFCYEEQEIVPFLEYMEKYKPDPDDSPKEKNKKTKNVQEIKARLRYLVDEKGSYHVPPYIEKYINREIGILKIKLGRTLVRIAFYTHLTEEFNRIILLNAFEKPSSYEKVKKRRVDAQIQNALNEAENFRDNYLKSKSIIPLNIFSSF
jgi:hypothetical protein